MNFFVLNDEFDISTDFSMLDSFMLNVEFDLNIDSCLQTEKKELQPWILQFSFWFFIKLVKEHREKNKTNDRPSCRYCYKRIGDFFQAVHSIISTPAKRNPSFQENHGLKSNEQMCWLVSNNTSCIQHASVSFVNWSILPKNKKDKSVLCMKGIKMNSHV